jgi:4-hydroxybenzoate polyprenyltransferase
MYRLDSLVAGSEAALAAAFFTITLFGLKKRQRWAPILVIGITVTQRVFAFYVFFPSIAIPIPLIWSLVIIYFAFKDIKTPKSTP